MSDSPRSTILPAAGENTDVHWSTGRLANPGDEDLPHEDPIAYLGTGRHPLSTPPTILDLEPSHAPSAYSTAPHPKSPVAERIAMTALAALLVLPILLGLSRSTSPENAGVSHRDVARRVGVTSMVLPKSVAAVEGTRNPQGTPNEEPLPVAAAPAELQLQPLEIKSRRWAVEGLRRAASDKPRDTAPAAPRSPAFDFSAALDAVTGVAIGPRQCGAEAVGTAAVAVTFAPSGNVTRAVVEGGPLQGTDAGSCIATRLKDVAIVPFEGGLATVRTNVFLR